MTRLSLTLARCGLALIRLARRVAPQYAPVFIVAALHAAGMLDADDEPGDLDEREPQRRVWFASKGGVA